MNYDIKKVLFKQEISDAEMMPTSTIIILDKNNIKFRLL